MGYSLRFGRCAFRKQDSPEGGGVCGHAVHVCPSSVSVICPGILDDWVTGEWICSVHIKRLYNRLRANCEQSNMQSQQCVLALTCRSVSAKPHLLSCC